jgi:hypothetical protein
MAKIVTVLPEDSLGISKILKNYVVESRFEELGECSTKVEISHYYSATGMRARLLHLIAGRKIARDTNAMLKGIKAAIEGQKR